MKTTLLHMINHHLRIIKSEFPGTKRGRERIPNQDKTSSRRKPQKIDSCLPHSENSRPIFEEELSSELRKQEKHKDAVSSWKKILGGKQARIANTPLCKGHRLPCILLRVTKKGPNTGRQFWVCSKPVGDNSDPNSRCNFFAWYKSSKVLSVKYDT
eukprot:817792_1